jgi:serine/threonine-protein kinase
LPAFLQGTYQPQDNDERIALVGICQSQGRGHAAARLFADAFATDPALEEALVSTCRAGAGLGDRQLVGRTEELATECRYPAARCAALAGCGLGVDGTDLGDAERSHWRKQARDWLRADLLMWETTLQEGSPAARELIRALLTYWQSEPDLAGLREPGALERFSAEERQECVSLWRDVTVLLDRSKAAK